MVGCVCISASAAIWSSWSRSIRRTVAGLGCCPFWEIKRDDGSMQWAYKGKPLYTFFKDKNPGDRTGDGFKDVWHTVKE